MSLSEYSKLLKDYKAPIAFVDVDALDRNIERVNMRRGSKKIRVATKSIRCRWAMDRIAKHTDGFCGWMTFSVDEALWLASLGYTDILMGYPSLEKETIQTIFAQGFAAEITFMVDAIEHLQFLNSIANDYQATARVCVDVDMSSSFPFLHFGVLRSPVRSADKLRQLVSATKELSAIKWVGLMGYEAQIAGVGDAVPGQALKSVVIKLLKKKSLKELVKRRKDCLAVFKDFQVELEFVNGGGTGSMETTREEEGVTEITVGSGYFQSHLFDYYTQFQHEAAAFFAHRVVRIPNEKTATVLGGGYIASGATDTTKQPIPVFPEGLKLTVNEGAGEVQTPLQMAHPNQLKIGDLVIFRHAKAGELCERFEQLYLLQSNAVIDQVPTYRGEQKCFL